jgi:hypothetical protein
MASDTAIAIMNSNLSKRHTVGGRVGSGLGTLLEAEWGFTVSEILHSNAKSMGVSEHLELAWVSENTYNDFALLDNEKGAAATWTPQNHRGELLRLEVKSMALDAEESKAHFDATRSEIGKHDLLVVLLWRWAPVPGRPGRVCPEITGSWLGSAREIAALRDSLHTARGGSFVAAGECPDGCVDVCSHVGEPLNAAGTRERFSGPSCCVTGGTLAAQNFGGLVRMLKTRGNAEGLKALRSACQKNAVSRSYVDFIHQSFPNEEQNTFSKKIWLEVAAQRGIKTLKTELDAVATAVRKTEGYRDLLMAA